MMWAEPGNFSLMGVKSVAIVAVVTGGNSDLVLVKDQVLVIGYGLGLTIPIDDGIVVVGIKIKRRINRTMNL